MNDMNDKLHTPIPAPANGSAEQHDAGYTGGRCGQPCPMDDSLNLHEAEERVWCARGCSARCAEQLCEYLRARKELRAALETLGHELTGVNVYDIGLHRYAAWRGINCIGIYDTDRHTFVD